MNETIGGLMISVVRYCMVTASSSGPSQGLKIWGARSTLAGIICPTLVEIGLTVQPNIGVGGTECSNGFYADI